MKTKLILLLSIATASLALAATTPEPAGARRAVTLAWDANAPAEQVAEYRLYLKAGDAWVKSGVTAATELTADLPDGPCEVAVTAVSALGLESLRSAPLTIPANPEPPQNLRIKITIQLQSSRDLKDWTELAQIQVPHEASPSQFFRTLTR